MTNELKNNQSNVIKTILNHPWLRMVNIQVPPIKNGDDWGMVYCFTHSTENTDGRLLEILVKVNPIDKYLIQLDTILVNSLGFLGIYEWEYPMENCDRYSPALFFCT